MKTLVKTKGLSNVAWLEQRRCGIAGSDAPIILGLSKYRSVLQLWQDKTGKIPIEETESDYTYFGHVMEPVIKKEFMKRSGLKVRARNEILQNEEYPFMIANLDGVVKEKDGSYSVFEAKTASEYKRKVWEEGVPEEYIAQVQHYMCVTGYQKAYVCAVVGGNSFYCHVIERNDEYIKELIKKERDFWNCVESGILPEPDSSKATEDFLNENYPVSNKRSVELPEEADQLVKNYHVIEDELKRLNVEKTRLTNLLKNMLKDNEKGYIGPHVVSWSNVEKRTLDSKRVKDVLGNSYEEYLMTSSYRKFHVA